MSDNGKIFLGKKPVEKILMVGDAPASEEYTGETEVTPNFEKQTLHTKGLVMPKNVTVEAISVSKTSNKAGGNTVYIGGMING